MENEITVKIPVQTKLQLCRSSTFSCAMWLNVGPGFKSTLIKSKTKIWRKRQKNSRSLFVFLYKKYLNFYIITWNIHSQTYGHSVQQPIIYMLTHFIRNEKSFLIDFVLLSKLLECKGTQYHLSFSLINFILLIFNDLKK